MRDAYGGILNIFLIVLFLLIVSGSLAYLVTYTKAFKMKNYIISSIENFEGRKDCFSASKGNSHSCSYEIFSKADSIGYSAVMKDSCPKGFEEGGNGLFCYCALSKNKNGEEYCNTVNTYNANKYRIITRVDITIPIIRDVFNFGFFQVIGDTKYMKD